MATKKDPRGGHPNSGRKPIADKAIPVLTYVRESLVNKAGGIDQARLIAKEAVEKEAAKTHVKKQ